MPASSTYFQLFLFVLLLTDVINAARISQRLVGGHAKVENKNEEPPATEEKKTLSQQVAEGKYGLIQKELFEKQPKRPGVLSYENNADVPKDNENSLGGLGPDEIWLAEDHLLVLKGGSFHRTASASELPWPPIDDYRAPNRQVKIPSQPKVPPPFPVQLSEGGPLQFFGLNITRAPNGSLSIPGADGAPPIFFPLPPDGAGQHSANATAGGAPFPLPPYIIGDGPENFNRGNGQSPPFPYPYPIPIPSPGPNPNQLPPFQNTQNQSLLDEDDPSIYYPPPYSFFYPKDNSSKVPPGPLVPGIVLPPPPDFFAPLDPITTTTSSTTTATTTTTTTTTTPIPTTTRTIQRRPPTTTPPPPKTHIIVTEAPQQQPQPQKPPLRYLPYDNSKTKYVPTKPHLINFHQIQVPYDENELTNTRHHYYESTTSTSTSTSRPEHIIRIPVKQVQVIQDVDQRPRTRLRPTSAPVHTTPTVYFSEEFQAKIKQPPPRVTTVPIPVVQISYGGGNGNQRPRTYLKPAGGTVSPVPVLQSPRTYLKPTGGPQTSPISIYLPFTNNKQVKGTSTQVPSVATVVPVLRLRNPNPQTQVSSTAVPLKTYYSDVNTNSVQPQAEYYFYEEDTTPQPIPQRLRYAPPSSNFEKHIQQLRQQIQSYLKPAARPRPVYEYSYQAANYRPTPPPNRYLTPSPQQYISEQRPRYQDDQTAYYTKQDERLLDDITKKYFTVFGQKITTPITPQHSLAGDTLVNYRKAHPTNHESEYINIRPQRPHKQSPGEPGTFISYALPGEGAHFYFLTPQLVQQQQQLQQQQQQQQQNAYYYEKPQTSSRIRRRNQR